MLCVVLGVIFSFALTFFAFGIAWAGAPFPLQLLFSLAFFAVSFALTRFPKTRKKFGWPMLIGLFPIGSIYVRARDPSGSHLWPVAIVVSWIAAIILGDIVGAWRARR